MVDPEQSLVSGTPVAEEAAPAEIDSGKKEKAAHTERAGGSRAENLYRLKWNPAGSSSPNGRCTRPSGP
jgi:hypothetical protein